MAPKTRSAKKQKADPSKSVGGTGTEAQVSAPPSAQEEPPFAKLPAELQAQVFGFCPTEDLIGLCVVSKLVTKEALRALVRTSTLRTTHDVRGLVALLEKHPWLGASVVEITQKGATSGKYTNRQLNDNGNLAPFQGHQWVKQTTALVARCPNLQSFNVTSADIPRLWHSRSFQTAATGLRKLRIDGTSIHPAPCDHTVPVLLAQIRTAHPSLSYLTIALPSNHRFRPGSGGTLMFLDTLVKYEPGARALRKIEVEGIEGTRNRAQRRALATWSRQTGVVVSIRSGGSAMSVAA